MKKGSHITPPRLAEKLLLWFIKDELAEEVLGDLDEKFYSTLDKHSKQKAKRNYWYQVINYLRPFALRWLKTRSYRNTMIVHNVKASFRHLMRNKIYSLINLGGLAIGLAACLVIYQYIHFEKSYDNFHTKASSIYRLKQDDLKNGNNLGTILQTHALGPAAQENIPALSHVTRIRSHYDGIVIVTNPETNAPLKEDGLLSVDNAFFQLFDFPLSIGDKNTALLGKNNVVISQEVANRHFGKQNPLGKILQVRGGAANGDYTVTGVLQDIPSASHLQFNILLPIENEIDRYNSMNLGGWTAMDFATYVQIKDSQALAVVAKQLNRLVNEHSKANKDANIGFQPLADIHLGRTYNGDIATANSSQQSILLFSMVAVFMLLIAWANYINLATAKALKRTKEVGIRKSLGAFRGQLMGQFLAESFLINTTASLFAFGLAYISLPVLSEVVDKPIRFDLLTIPAFWLYVIGILILGSLLSGFYPALVLSGFKPINLLTGTSSSGNKRLLLRRGLIIFQFTISLLLISGTYLIHSQISFMRQQNLGVDMEKTLIVESHRTGQKWSHHRVAQEIFKTEVAKHASVINSAGSGRVPGRGFNIRANVKRLDTPEQTEHFAHMVFADNDFIPTYGFEYITGDTISPAFYQSRKATVINEEAVVDFGFSSPYEALNKQVMANNDTFVIKGVLKNFHWDSLKDPYSPYMFLIRPGGRTFFSLKINLTDIPETLAHVEATYNTVFPENPFYTFFLDDDFNRQYKTDSTYGNLLACFSVLAILIAAIGLFALVAYSTILRTKEISIRKVLGANLRQLVILLCREYLWLTLGVIAISTPVVIYIGQSWLQNYAFHVGIGLDVIVVPAVSLTMITMLTIGYRTVYTAKANPVNSLRSE